VRGHGDHGPDGLASRAGRDADKGKLVEVRGRGRDACHQKGWGVAEISRCPSYRLPATSVDDGRRRTGPRGGAAPGTRPYIWVRW
jgi:hypothetical protein